MTKTFATWDSPVIIDGDAARAISVPSVLPRMSRDASGPHDQCLGLDNAVLQLHLTGAEVDDLRIQEDLHAHVGELRACLLTEFRLKPPLSRARVLTLDEDDARFGATNASVVIAEEAGTEPVMAPAIRRPQGPRR